METKLKSSLASKLVILLKNFSSAFEPEVISKGGLQTAIVLYSYLENIDAAKLCEILAKYIQVRQSSSYY